MNNGYKPSKVTVNIETMPYFSASIADMRISPVTRVILGEPEAASGPSKLELSIVGKCGDNEFIKRCDFEKQVLDFDAYNLKNSSSCVLEFDSSCFEYDNAFLNSIEDEIQGEVYVLINYRGVEYVARSPITLLPSDMWPGLDGEPSVIASYIYEDCQAIDNICDGVCENGKISYSTDSKKSVAGVVRELYKRLKDCNIIYTRPAGYAANIRQRIRRPDTLFSSASILATPLEIALVFTDCAKKLGFDTSLMFVRGKKGDISVLCGVYLVKSPVKVPVYEDAEKIRALIEAGDMLVIDPSVFAAAQNTSFMFALDTTAESFIQDTSSLVCLVDVKRSLICADKKDASDEFENLPVKNAVARVYSSLVSSPVMQMLSGKKRREIETVPLLLADFQSVFCNDSATFKLRPIDVSVSLDDFAPIDKNFSSMITYTSPKARQHFSNNELALLKSKFAAFKEKVASDCEITTGLRDDELYRVCSDIAFGKNKKEPYFSFGYVKITDKLTETVSFAPICLVKASLCYESGDFYVKQVGKPIVNKVFIRNALRDSSLGYDSFMKSLMPTDKKEIFDMFDNIRMALTETDDRHIYEIIREANIVNVEIDDYMLWSDLARARKKISSGEVVKSVFESKRIEAKITKDYIPSKPLFSDGLKAVCNDTSMVVEGAFTKDKEDVISSMVSRSIGEGKSMLVVTDDMEMSRYVERILGSDGFGDMVYVLDDDCKSSDAAKRICDNIEKYKDEEVQSENVAFDDLLNADKILVDYTSRMNRKTKLGMSVKEAVSAYLSAASGTDLGDDIHVDKAVFKDADSQKLDNIFELSGGLITSAATLCKCSGLAKHTPIKKHPLFFANPAREVSETEKDTVRVAIATALPAISEYRDVFSDVNEILGFDERDIDCLYKLEKLNDLYKLVLTARDLDIPEKFVESDITFFTKNKRFALENRKRMEAIEFKLNFFSHEIFEDIENLLRGDELDEEQDAGFIKKFMTKKNSQDKLLQYVESDKKSEFQQHKLQDLYKLLYEYKSCVINLKETNNYVQESEEAIRLAQISDKAAYLVDAISSKEDNKKLLSNVFRLISVIPVDSSLARKITVSRARLAEVYSGETSPLATVSKLLGIRFDDIVFTGGVLAFDGLGKYLEDVDAKLDCLDLWISWQNTAKEARELVPGFVKYLEDHGACASVDRIFAKSLLSLVSECIKEEVMSGLSLEKLSRAKDKYTEYLYKSCELSKEKTLSSYIETVKQISLSHTFNSEQYEKGDFRDFCLENEELTKKTLPVIVVTKTTLTEALPLEIKFDSVVVLDNRHNGFTMLPAFSFADKCVLVNMSKSARSELCARFADNVPVFDVCRMGKDRDIAAFSWINSQSSDEDMVCINSVNRQSIEIVRMNGIYDRTGTRSNKTEAELSLVKATGILQDASKKVAVTAFTKEQCTDIEKLLHVITKKNKILADALNEGRISVCTPDRLYMKEYDSLIVSACIGADRDSRLGWDFGYAAISGGEKMPEGYLSICDRLTEKTFFLTSLNVKDARFLRRTGNNALVFGGFCEMLSESRISVNMKNALPDRNEGILSGIMSCVIDKEPVVGVCEGSDPIKYALRGNNENGTYVLLDNENDLSMHDELLIKKCLEDCGKLVTTMTVMQLCGKTCSETISGLVKQKDNI